MSKQSLSRRGFSLVELSIVIIIIGFLISGVSTGQSLIKQAALSSTVLDYQRYITALNAFKTRYSYLPGDFPYARSYWPTATNGNGDDRITQGGTSENSHAWRHLSLARMVPENFTIAGTTPPKAKIWEKARFDFSYETVFGVLRNGLILGGSNAFTNLAALTVHDAFILDQKMDNGNPGTGKMVVFRGTDATGSRCVDNNYNQPLGTVVNFNFNDTLISCRTRFYFETN